MGVSDPSAENLKESRNFFNEFAERNAREKGFR